MDAEVTIAEFKHQLKVRGYAKKTIEGYSWNIDQFKQYLQDCQLDDLRKVTRQVIVDYQQKVMAQPIAMESKALKLRPVKRLFEYLTEHHRLLINPAEGIVETCRKNRKIGTVLTIEEIKRLMAQPNLSLRIHIRNRAIMEVLYASGIRLDELLRLQVYDADLKDKVLYIRKGKGRRQRVVPLGKHAARYLKEYLENIRPRYANKNPKARALFLNVYGHPPAAGSVQTFIRNYGIEAGIKKPVSPHTLRRSCATHMLQQGADIRYIQRLLGHKHLSSTQAYTKVMPIEIKETHNKTHPGIRGQMTDGRGQKKRGKKAE